MSNLPKPWTARCRGWAGIIAAPLLIWHAACDRPTDPPAHRSVEPASGLSAEPVEKSLLPRFALAVGQELRYRAFEASYTSGNQVARNADGMPKNADRRDLTLYVVGQDPDGNFQLAMVALSDGYPVLIRASLFADGRTTPQGNRPWSTLRDIFPLLPTDAAQQRDGWQEQIDEDSTGKYSFDGQQIRREAILNGYPGGRALRTYRQKPGMGIPELIVEEGTYNAVDHGAPKERQMLVLKAETRIELQSFEQHPPDWTDRVNADLRRYETASKEFSRSVSGNQVPLAVAAKDPAEMARILDQRRASLADAVNEIGTTAIRRALAEKLAKFDKYRANDENKAKRLSTLANLPAPQWEAKDLDGRPHTLQQYEDQVVVMDFWFRGCTGCYKVAPQINAAAAHFEKTRARVQFLNVTFEEAENARAARDKLQSHGPVLLGRDLEATFALEVYPTLIVLDQQGIVRGFFPGYSDERGEELTSFVESLLAEKPEPTHEAKSP